MCLKKNCYGLPNAGRTWAQHRDKFMMEHFNKGNWRCHRCTYDPCLFYIQRGPYTDGETRETGVFFDKDGKLDVNKRPAREEAWVMIHTDDCDAVGTSKSILNDIYQAHASRWQAKVIDADYLLGITREYKRIGTEYSCELTMTAFVEGMKKAFDKDVPKTVPSTPFTQGVYLHKTDCESDEEADELLKNYQRVVGMLLWACRGVFPECQFGLSQLTKVMSRPSYNAYKEAMRMIAWMYSQRDRGIKFTSTGNAPAVAFSDASNKPDPNDGLCHYGFVLMFKGGPIASVSKKLAHVGLSAHAMHNEYMALRFAASTVTWYRQLMSEIGCKHYVSAPTLVYGDNSVANTLVKEDYVSTGNQHIYVPYHWVKELQNYNIIDVNFIHGKKNLADLFTKPVTKQVIDELLKMMLGYDTSWSSGDKTSFNSSYATVQLIGHVI